MLNGCSDAGADWFVTAVETWFNANGFAVQEGLEVDLDKMVGYLIDQAVDEYTNSDEANALDAARGTLADIELADQHLENALDSNNPNEIEKAKNLRPDDITYVEAEVAIWMTSGNNAAVRTSINESDRITANFVSQGGNCRAARLNQLRTRQEMLVRQLDDPTVENDIVVKDNINQMLGDVDSEIQSILGEADNLFCAQLGADIIDP
jgi:hypothetical protein